MKVFEMEILHYNRKREKIDISSPDNKKHIKEIVEVTINKALSG